jgi:hypothetical protein
VYIYILKYEYIYIFMSKEIILSTEAMTFFLLNMFGHDPALHDFTPGSEMAKKRVSNSAGKVQSVIDMFSSSRGGKNIQKGGEPTEELSEEEKLDLVELNPVMVQTFKNTVYQTMIEGCIKDSIYYSENGELLIIDWNVINATRGAYTGYVYTWEETYSPFDLNFMPNLLRPGYATFQNYQEIDGKPFWTRRIVISQDNCEIQAGNGDIKIFQRLYSNATNKDQVLTKLFSPENPFNPNDQLEAYMSTVVLRKITKNASLVEDLLDGTPEKFIQIINNGLSKNDELDESQSLLNSDLKVKFEEMELIPKKFYCPIRNLQKVLSPLQMPVNLQVNLQSIMIKCSRVFVDIQTLDEIVNEIRGYFGVLTNFVQYFLQANRGLLGQNNMCELNDTDVSVGEVLINILPKLVMKNIIKNLEEPDGDQEEPDCDPKDPKELDGDPEDIGKICNNISTFVQGVNMLGNKSVGIQGKEQAQIDNEDNAARLWLAIQSLYAEQKQVYQQQQYVYQQQQYAQQQQQFQLQEQYAQQLQEIEKQRGVINVKIVEAKQNYANSAAAAFAQLKAEYCYLSLRLISIDNVSDYYKDDEKIVLEMDEKADLIKEIEKYLPIQPPPTNVDAVRIADLREEALVPDEEKNSWKINGIEAYKPFIELKKKVENIRNMYPAYYFLLPPISETVYNKWKGGKGEEIDAFLNSELQKIVQAGTPEFAPSAEATITTVVQTIPEIVTTMDKIVGGVFSQIRPDEAAIIKLNSRLGSIGGLEIFKVSKIINFLQNMLNTCVSEENDESEMIQKEKETMNEVLYNRNNAMFDEIRRLSGAENEVIESEIQKYTNSAEGDRFQGMVNLMSFLEEQQLIQNQHAQSTNMSGGGFDNPEFTYNPRQVQVLLYEDIQIAAARGSNIVVDEDNPLSVPAVLEKGLKFLGKPDGVKLDDFYFVRYGNRTISYNQLYELSRIAVNTVGVAAEQKFSQGVFVLTVAMINKKKTALKKIIAQQKTIKTALDAVLNRHKKSYKNWDESIVKLKKQFLPGNRSSPFEFFLTNEARIYRNLQNVYQYMMALVTFWLMMNYRAYVGRALPPNKKPYFEIINYSKENFEKFLVSFKNCVELYEKLTEQAIKVLDFSPPTTTTNDGNLSGAQRTAMGYALGAILAATKTPLERANLLDNPSSLVNIELSMFNNLLASKANMRTKLQSGFSGDYDTKLYKQFLRHISLNPPHNVGFMCADPRFKDFCSQDYKNVNMFEVLNTDPMWQGQALNEMGVASKNEWRAQQLRFWMSNAVNAPNTINYLKGNFFCTTQEVADNQPTCSTAQKSKEKEGLEWGIIDVIIHDGAKYSGGVSSGQKMLYRIRAVPMGKAGDDIPSELHISAYVKVGDQVLINRSDGQKGTGWPDDPTPLNGPIVCPLDGRKPVPMDATTCLKTILETLSSPPFHTITSYEQLINILCDYDRGQIFRRALLEKSFVKGLGDFLQEVNGITMNSGYVDGTRRTAPPNDVTIVPPYSPSEPTGYRLQLSNDRPSGIRALLFLLYGSGDIPKNSVAGYLTEHKELGAKWAVAGRMKGGKRKTRKIKRKKRKSKRKVIKKQRKSIHRKRKKRKSKNRRIKH